MRRAIKKPLTAISPSKFGDENGLRAKVGGLRAILYECFMQSRKLVWMLSPAYLDGSSEVERYSAHSLPDVPTYIRQGRTS